MILSIFIKKCTIEMQSQEKQIQNNLTLLETEVFYLKADK